MELLIHSHISVVYERMGNFIHKPYSRQVTELMECDVVTLPPPTVYPLKVY